MWIKDEYGVQAQTQTQTQTHTYNMNTHVETLLLAVTHKPFVIIIATNNWEKEEQKEILVYSFGARTFENSYEMIRDLFSFSFNMYASKMFCARE